MTGPEANRLQWKRHQDMWLDMVKRMYSQNFDGRELNKKNNKTT